MLLFFPNNWCSTRFSSLRADGESNCVMKDIANPSYSARYSPYVDVHRVVYSSARQSVRRL
jgi:hypothetical protein